MQRRCSLPVWMGVIFFVSGMVLADRGRPEPGGKSLARAAAVERVVPIVTTLLLGEAPVRGGPMAAIPAGCFDMGDPFGEGSPDELPVHEVCISAFQMDVHEVTNAEYAECVAGGGCTSPVDSSSATRATYYGDPAYGDFPVIWVNWSQAEQYCTWAGKRLPTEAEWEYAARGGLAGKRYPWGDAAGGADANYRDSGDPWDNDTSRGEHYAPNGYGLYDMAGNAYEWVNDWYKSDYYSESPTHDPAGPASGTSRVMRGGSWTAPTFYLRMADRGRVYIPPFSVEDHVGFRCAR